MTIQDWGAIGEIVGAVAVVVTLVYLAKQIRQNTHAMEEDRRLALAQTYQLRADALQAMSVQAADSEHIGPIIVKLTQLGYPEAVNALEQLTPEERGRFRLWQIAQQTHWDNMHFQYPAGLSRRGVLRGCVRERVRAPCADVARAGPHRRPAQLLRRDRTAARDRPDDYDASARATNSAKLASIDSARTTSTVSSPAPRAGSATTSVASVPRAIEPSATPARTIATRRARRFQSRLRDQCDELSCGRWATSAMAGGDSSCTRCWNVRDELEQARETVSVRPRARCDAFTDQPIRA